MAPIAPAAFGLHDPKPMSRFAGLVVLLLGSAALAEVPEPPPNPPEFELEAAPPHATESTSPVRYRVVKILAESEQALLFDKVRGRHVLIEVGELLGEYTVQAIDVDAVTLDGTDTKLVLAAPAPAWREGRGTPARPARSPAEPAPEDPYAPAGDDAVDPGPPIAGDPSPSADDTEEVRVVSAPETAAGHAFLDEDDDIRSASAADVPPPDAPEGASSAPPSTSSAPPPGPVAVPSEAAPPPTTTSAPAAPPAPSLEPAAQPPRPAAGPATTTLSRTEVDAALADFGALARSFDATFTPAGLRLDAVATGSLFAKAGLRTGDVITTVEGQPLRSLDDAADLYARAATLPHATVELLRGGKPLTLRVVLR